MGDFGLDQALGSVGLSLRDLRGAATEVVVFGSRAAGMARDGSDWDVLCVGDGCSRSVAAVDIVWVSTAELMGAGWLGSELAGHVARWGRWIWGEGQWRGHVEISRATVDRKARRVVSRALALASTWEGLSVRHRCKHFSLLRRDLQRFGLLSDGKMIPPTGYLDAEVHRGRGAWKEIHALAERLEILPLFERFCAIEGNRTEESTTTSYL